YTVGIGDPSRPKNVSVKSTSVLEKARPNEPFAVDAVLTAQQLKGARIQVDLLRESVDSTGSTVGEALVVESRERIVDDAAWHKR
ncbi:MAG: hypothetical protein VXZ63_09520, partial [Planctomycetota bacterium]|nr:hypothetical protein [Planctomycetota bacterium]